MADLKLTERKNVAKVIYTEGVYSLAGNVTLFEESKTLCSGSFDINKKVDSVEKHIGRLVVFCQKNEDPKIDLTGLTIEDLLIITPIANEMIEAIEVEYSAKNISLN